MTEADILALTYQDSCWVYRPQKTTLPSGESVFQKGLDGRQVYESPDVCSIREYSKKELAAFWEEYRRILNPHTYKVDISDKLYNLKMELIHENREEYEQEDC